MFFVLMRKLLENCFLISKMGHSLSKNQNSYTQHCSNTTQISNTRDEDYISWDVIWEIYTNVSMDCTAFKPLVTIYQLTQHNIPENLYLQQHCYENIKSHTVLRIVTTMEQKSNTSAKIRERPIH
jgi:hypothetical protein